MSQKRIEVKHRGVATIFKKAALQFVLHWLRKRKCKKRIHAGWVESINQVAACNPHWPSHMAAQDWCGTFVNVKGKREWMPGAYQQYPDLAAALLNFLRQKWSKLEKSRAGRLKRFLSSSTVAKWNDEFNSRAAVVEAEEKRKMISAITPKRPPGFTSSEVTEEDRKFSAEAAKIWASRKHSGIIPDEFGNVSQWDLHDGELAIAFEKLPGGNGVTIDEVAKARKWVAKEQIAGEKFATKVLDENGFLFLKEIPTKTKQGG
jgi:hypothetical protein